MKKTRYSEEQIIGILKEAEVGALLRSSAGGTGSVMRPTITGRPDMGR